MATVVSTPVKTWVATVYAGGALAAGSSFTLTVHLTQAWELQLPCGCRYGTNVSLASIINVFPSNDGGVSYDSVALYSFAIPTLASGKQVVSVRLSTGQYCVQMLSSSPSVTFFALTQEVITGVANV